MKGGKVSIKAEINQLNTLIFSYYLVKTCFGAMTMAKSTWKSHDQRGCSNGNLVCTSKICHRTNPDSAFSSNNLLNQLKRVFGSAQRVLEPDPLPGISFDTPSDSVLEIIR